MGAFSSVNLHLCQESRSALLFGRRTPAHVDAEHVRADGEEQMERNASEENRKERHPEEVLAQ